MTGHHLLHMEFVLLLKILLVHPSVLPLKCWLIISFAFIFFDMELCSVIHQVLAGKTIRWLWIGGQRAVLVVFGQLDPLLVHTLGLHPLD